ncbi:MAG: hypothetical protein E7Z93_02100 [Cyanobacteria bacterium SIG32]|nr:hypothetical protein [Cyanobacteria bacterium SIG32]
MDRDELIFQEYKMYAEQKENFIDRNFRTNRFYMISFVAIIFAMIFTGNVVFMERLSATLLFSLIGIAVCILWWMNVDSYNTLIKIKFANVLEVLEEKLPVKPFTDEYKAIEEFRNKKIFMFSDIQKIIAVVGALFFFAVFVSELSPIVVRVFEKIVSLLGVVKGGI